MAIAVPVRVRAGPFARGIGLRELLLHRLVGGREEDDLAVGRLGHGLHGFEVADLHRGRAAEDVGRLAHQFGAFDLGARGDDFALADAFRLRGHAEAVLQFAAEHYVLDQHALHLHAPPRRDVFDDFANRLRNFLAAFDHVLEYARANHVAESGLRALDQCLADVGDAKGGFVGGYDVVVDD